MMHKLDEIAEKVKTCQNCKLCETRTKAVPGKGRFDADVIFVGEAPGKNEDVHGEPFVGAAGKRLDMILEDTGIIREDIYITNIVKCRPPKNRVPSKKEEESCNDFNDLFTGKPHPTLIKLWMGGKIQLESVVIMEKMFEFCKSVTATDPVWQDAKSKITKYEPLLKTSTDKHRKILKELYL